MSAPTKQLGKLSIGGSMPTTRGQVQGEPAATRPEDDLEDSSSDDEVSNSEEEDAGGSSPPPLVDGNSGITYNIGPLPRELRSRAIAGLTGLKFRVDVCRTTRSGLEFQVADHGKVFLGQQGPMTCNCLDFRQSRDACRHIFWLTDQLHRCVLPGAPAPGLPLLRTGACPDLPPIYNPVSDNIEEIAKAREWLFIPDAGSTDSSDQESGPTMSRPEKVRDLLSAFTSAMPDEFRTDQAAETISQPRTPEGCVVQRDFEATMLRLAVQDEALYNSLRKAMPSPARAKIFFEKIEARYKKLLSNFDEYRKNGPMQVEGAALEIGVVINELHGYVAQIKENIELRAPHSFTTAPDALITLLRDISKLNYDAFEDNNWDRDAPPTETEDDRNLFLRLIGKPDITGQYFILDVLDDLPPCTLKDREDQIKEIMSNIRVSNMSSKAYLQKLQSLLHRDRAAGMGPGTTTYGQKRPAAGTPGSGRKRTK
ncbi:hypothetical protein FQN52_002238 [Onygenales sp. PD_12]|nr:hypothetical protein FQN52_002238 [Onygenales sp. PD_12]